MERFLRVECRLATPVAGLNPPHLDSLLELVYSRLAKSIMESSNGDRHAYIIASPGHDVAIDAIGKLPIPICRTWIGELPIPRCSSPILGAVTSDHAAHYTTAFPLGKAEHVTEPERTKIMQTGGRFKSFRLPLRMQLVDRIVWFCVSREKPSELRKRVRQIRHLGKKSSQGHGVIAEWIVEPCEHDWSWYADSPAGPVLMRPLPADMKHPAGLIGFRRSFGGCVGPYWDRRFFTEIIEPC